MGSGDVTAKELKGTQMKAAKAQRQQQPKDEIMRHTVQATAPGLTAVHPPRPDAREVKVPDLRTADHLAFTGRQQGN